MGYIIDTRTELQKFKDLLKTVKEKYDAEPLALHIDETVSAHFEPGTTEEDLDLILQDLNVVTEPYYNPDAEGIRVGRAWFSNGIWADLVLDQYCTQGWDIYRYPALPVFDKWGKLTNTRESMV